MKLTEETQQKYKNIICNIAKAFDAFCQKYNLRYFGIGGTAIGALRHGGIIPWDDDIDVAMPRPDYEQFLSLCKELRPKYEVFTHRNTALYHLTMAKMCDANTSYIASFRQKVMLGAFIDIFPIDACPGSTAEERELFFNSYMKLRHNGEAIQNFYTLRDLFSAIYSKRWIEIPRQLLSHYYHLIKKNNPYFAQCDKILMRTPYEKSDYVAYFGTWRGTKVISPKVWFNDFYYVDFEDFKIRLPIGVHDYLTQLYGNYMTPPPTSVIAKDYHSFSYINLEKRISWQEARKNTLHRNII